MFTASIAIFIRHYLLLNVLCIKSFPYSTNVNFLRTDTTIDLNILQITWHLEDTPLFTEWTNEWMNKQHGKIYGEARHGGSRL